MYAVSAQLQPVMVFQAGIPSKNLKLALELEAAAIYVSREAKNVHGKNIPQTYDLGNKILVADLGGKI